MKITVNGEPRDVVATRLDTILTELDYGDARVATAVNGDFVSAGERRNTELAPGDQLEVLAPMQGG